MLIVLVINAWRCIIKVTDAYSVWSSYMRETSRQYVIFGNFSKISFESITQLSEIKDEYGFELVGKEDMPIPPENPQQPINFSFQPPAVRPVFFNASNKITVFFGTNRIHVEQTNGESDEYDAFSKTARDILSRVIEIFDLNVFRVAVNGTLLIENSDCVKTMFNKFLKESTLNNNPNEEWFVRVNPRAIDESIMNLTNRIVIANHVLLNSVQMSELSTKVSRVLFLSYDYNTVEGLQRNPINKGLLPAFYSSATNFRKKVISNE